MSHQVNFRLCVYDCSREEAIAAANMQQQLQEAIERVLLANGLGERQCVLGPAEVAYLRG